MINLVNLKYNLNPFLLKLLKKNYIAIIPARGGSKGLKRKNILPFNGRPLISWSIDFIKKSGVFNRCLTSTDSEEIALIAKEYGSEVPFLRSKELASDNASSSDVILDVISRCNLNKMIFSFFLSQHLLAEE